MLWPTLATTLSCTAGGCPLCMGKLVAAHSSSETSMITVPARYRKALPRSTRRKPSDIGRGQRYGGISSTNGVSLLRSTVEFSSFAVATAIRNPSTYRPSMATARVPSNGPSSGRFGQERGDHHGVHRQPGRAGHERRNQDGGNAVALALDGARRHDGRHCAGVGREQRDKALAVQAHARHGLVGDDRCARQIAGVFQDADHQEQQQNLRQEDQHRAGSLPHAIDEQRTQVAVRQQIAQASAGGIQPSSA